MDKENTRGGHTGHRQRLRERFLEHGLENFNDINALELLLHFAIPRRDTNTLAHNLLERFGSLNGVLDASLEELKSVPGLGENTAALLHLIPAVSKRYMVEKYPETEPIDTPTAAGRYFLPRFMYETQEVTMALLLDARKIPLSCHELYRGTVNASEIQTRHLAELCIRHHASAVVLAHNHPSGIPSPSLEDEETTKRLSHALTVLGIELADHIIVAGCSYVSMREDGLL